MNTTWPAGVIARYVTLAAVLDPAAVVDITHDTLTAADTEPNVTCCSCAGCGAYSNYEWAPRAGRFDNGRSWADVDARAWAQAHAEKCRALPNPDSAR